jgi:hypothetical protein
MTRELDIDSCPSLKGGDERTRIDSRPGRRTDENGRERPVRQRADRRASPPLRACARVANSDPDPHAREEAAQ